METGGDLPSIEEELRELGREAAIGRLQSLLAFIESTWSDEEDLREFKLVTGKELFQIVDGSNARFPPR